MHARGDEPLILGSAHNHGVADEDMLHAYHNAMTRHALDEGVTMILGGTRSGELLEVGAMTRDGWIFIIHAMRARAKFLPPRRGDHDA